ncbi:MAG TPA: YbaB/EbfC family nucleoid-associated protein [Mycobacteriales bacterium]|nr:YbaB/EbfC family nucleoid-associated protein [Mycobacteriales bacterium]
MDHQDLAAELHDLQAEYQQTRQRLATMQDGWAGNTATARAKGRQVSATVDGRGRLTEVRFHGQGYRSMPAAELGTLVVETVNRAHADVQRQLWASAAGYLPTGVTVDDVVGGDFNWASTLSAEIRLPALVQDLLDRADAAPAAPTPTPDGR